MPDLNAVKFVFTIVSYPISITCRETLGITNNEWFRFLAAKGSLEEINFWRPTPQPYRQDFYSGMPFLFKLHAPEEFIVGGGFFLRFVPVPQSLAWAAFHEANGASTLE